MEIITEFSRHNNHYKDALNIQLQKSQNDNNHRINTVALQFKCKLQMYFSGKYNYKKKFKVLNSVYLPWLKRLVLTRVLGIWSIYYVLAHHIKYV